MEDPLFAEDCGAVGFKMDGGKSITAIDPEKNWLKADVLTLKWLNIKIITSRKLKKTWQFIIVVITNITVE